MKISEGIHNRRILLSPLRIHCPASRILSSAMILFLSASLSQALSGQDTVRIKQPAEARVNALKLDFISLGTGSAILTYERNLNPLHNLEGSLGIIGFGIDANKENPSGILVKCGYKMFINPESYGKGRKFDNCFEGLYLKLEVDYANYSVESQKDILGETEKYRISKYAFLLVTGYQLVTDGNLLIEPYLGAGTGGNNLKHIDWSWPYGFMTGSNTFHTAVSFGVRIGFSY